MTGSRPDPTPTDRCLHCTHPAEDHVIEDDDAYCLGGTPTNPCRCTRWDPLDRIGAVCLLTPRT